MACVPYLVQHTPKGPHIRVRGCANIVISGEELWCHILKRCPWVPDSRRVQDLSRIRRKSLAKIRQAGMPMRIYQNVVLKIEVLWEVQKTQAWRTHFRSPWYKGGFRLWMYFSACAISSACIRCYAFGSTKK